MTPIHDETNACRCLLAALAMSAAFLVACGDEVPPSTTGSGGDGGSVVDGGGTADGGFGGAGQGGAGGTGGSAQGGSAQGGGGAMEGPTHPIAPNELNNASGQIQGGGFRLSFQLGRAVIQNQSNGGEHELMCAAPTINTLNH